MFYVIMIIMFLGVIIKNVLFSSKFTGQKKELKGESKGGLDPKKGGKEGFWSYIVISKWGWGVFFAFFPKPQPHLTHRERERDEEENKEEEE